jgi:hypothetical protein
VRHFQLPDLILRFDEVAKESISTEHHEGIGVLLCENDLFQVVLDTQYRMIRIVILQMEPDQSW